MAAAENHVESLRRELERVLASPGFARSERLSRLLRFIVERHLEGRDTELKESLIAIEVFGRPPDYDPKQDSIVRSEAARLRSRLVEYYAGEGSGDPVVIELPKGRYVPVLQPRASARGKTFPALTFPALTLGAVAVALAAAGWWWIQ